MNNSNNNNNQQYGLSRSLPELRSFTPTPKSEEGSDKPFIIGVTGGTASGKTSVCKIIVDAIGLDSNRVALISQDCFYKDLDELARENVHEYNFDHPGGLDC
jgi:uridine kinase